MFQWNRDRLQQEQQKGTFTDITDGDTRQCIVVWNSKDITVENLLCVPDAIGVLQSQQQEPPRSCEEEPSPEVQLLTKLAN